MTNLKRTWYNLSQIVKLKNLRHPTQILTSHIKSNLYQQSNPSPKMTRHKIVILLFVTAIAISTRFLYFLDFQHNVFFDNIDPGTDSYFFDLGAKNFSSGDILARFPAIQMSPLYTYFVGVIYKWGGANLTHIWEVQFSLGILTVLLIFLATLELFNVRSAFFAALLYNFYGPALMYEGVLLRTSLMTFLGILSFYLFIKAQKNPSLLLIAATGVSISLFIQCRPNVVLIFFLLPFMCNLSWNKQSLEFFLKISSVAVLFATPLLIRGWIIYGKPIFFSNSGPAAILAGNHPGYGGVGLSTIGVPEQYSTAGGSIMSWGEMIPVLLSRFMSHPLEMAGLYIRKSYFFFSAIEPFNNYDFLLFKKFSPLLNTPFSNFTLISSLALAGFIWKIGKGKNLRVLYSFILGSTLAVILFFILSRYRLPAVPFYAIFAGFTLDSMICSFEQNEWLKSVQILLMTLFLLIFLNIPHFTRGTQRGYPDKIIYQIGLRLVEAERYSEAIGPLREYLKKDPTNNKIQKYLGFTFWKIKRPDRAVLIYQKISNENPDDADAHFDLATLYATLGEKEKALFYMEFAERIFRQNNNLNGAIFAHEQIDLMKKGW